MWFLPAVMLHLLQVSATTLEVSPPSARYAVGFNNSNCEAHPHYGVQLQDGGWLMVGDSQCWDGSTPGMTRVIFVVAAEKNGTLRWSRRLGDIGFNYGKSGVQLKDGTIVVGGSKSVVDADAKRAGFDYIEARALWRLDQHTGALLSETTFPNEGKLSGLRDGVMCVSPTTDGTNDLVATGYAGGEANYDRKSGQYDDEPMFLIFNGVAFAARLSFSESDLSAPPSVTFAVKLGLNATYGFVPMQARVGNTQPPPPPPLGPATATQPRSALPPPLSRRASVPASRRPASRRLQRPRSARSRPTNTPCNEGAVRACAGHARAHGRTPRPRGCLRRGVLRSAGRQVGHAVLPPLPRRDDGRAAVGEVVPDRHRQPPLRHDAELSPRRLAWLRDRWARRRSRGAANRPASQGACVRRRACLGAHVHRPRRPLL